MSSTPKEKVMSENLMIANAMGLTRREIAAMREWIADVFGDDVAADLTKGQVVGAIRRRYDGGIEGFRRDAIPC